MITKTIIATTTQLPIAFFAVARAFWLSLKCHTQRLAHRGPLGSSFLPHRFQFHTKFTSRGSKGARTVCCTVRVSIRMKKKRSRSSVGEPKTPSYVGETGLSAQAQFYVHADKRKRGLRVPWTLASHVPA